MTAGLRSFRDDFRTMAVRFGDRPALVDATSGVVTSYAVLAERIEAVAAGFERQGVGGGSTVLALLPHSVETLTCFLATLHGGQGFAPLPVEITPRELRSWCALVRPVLALVDPALADDRRRVLESCGIACLEVQADGRFDWVPVAGPRPGAVRRGSARLFLTTSGSTGEPRALVFDGDRLWSSALAFLGHHGFVSETDRFLNMLPMSYLGGLFNLGLIPLAAGGSVVVWETFSGRSFLNFWQTVERFDVSVLWLVPTILRGLLSISERTRRTEIVGHQPAVRAAFLGTAPIDLAAKQRFEAAFGFPLLENFALSETTFFATETLNTRSRRLEGSMGQILPYVDLRLVPVDPEPGEGGPAPTEIRVRSPFLFLGYLQADGTVDLPLDAAGYFATGDLGHLDGDLLVVTGRRRDIIKKGGYFVSLREIEILAEQDEAVIEAAAVRISHDFYGESHVLYLRLADGSDEAAILARFTRWLHANLVRYKWPERIVSVADFPRTSSGKIRKHLLSEGAS